jgi:hypothetical protein
MNFDVREKMLITLACAAGILACGACTFKIPAPPLAPAINYSGIHSIGVDVSNLSASRHIDPSALARHIVASINENAKDTKVTAQAKEKTGIEDAVLKIVILDESATPVPQRTITRGQIWTIHVGLSATLKEKDGQVLWQEKEGNYRIQGFSKKPGEVDTPSVWKNFDAPQQLGSEMIRRMLFDEPPSYFSPR